MQPQQWQQPWGGYQMQMQPQDMQLQMQLELARSQGRCEAMRRSNREADLEEAEQQVKRLREASHTRYS